MFNWKRLFVPRFFGLKLKQNVVLVPDGFSLDCNNVFQNEKQVLSKRRGYTQTGDDVGPGDGSDGALTITNGNTTTISAGAIKNYSSVDIQTGGVLEIAAGGLSWTQVLCSGNFTCAGTIRGILGEHAGGTATVVTEDGFALSGTITQASAGAGGNSGGNAGGAANSGNGGGGGSVASVGVAAGASAGGNGANASSGAGAGAGASVYGNNGGNGTSITAGGGDYGGGGGGGSRGRHGALIYIGVGGTFDGTGGTINISGSNGGTGGTGGNSNAAQNGAGGGGGGAGGSGGKCVIRYRTAYTAPTFTTTAGTGGSGGAGGTGATTGGTGTSGGNGTAGTSDAAAGTSIVDAVGSCTLNSLKYWYRIVNGTFFYIQNSTIPPAIQNWTIATQSSSGQIAASTSATTTVKIWTAVLDNKLFIVDGTNVLRYFNGTAILDSKIKARPTVAITRTAGAGTGYTWLYTVDNGLGETGASPTITNQGSNTDTLRVSGTYSGESLAAGDVVRLYRRPDSVVGTSIKVFEYTWTAGDVTAGFHDFNTAAITLLTNGSQLYSEVGAQAINESAVTGLTGITNHYGRLVGWKGSKVYSAKRSNPHSWPSNAGANESFVQGFNENDGETIEACVSFLESLYVLKPSSGIVLYGPGPSDSGDDPYVPRRLELNGNGCVAGKSARVIEKMLVYLSRNGFVATTGTSPERIGEDIEPEIQAYPLSVLQEARAMYHKADGLYICFLGASGSRKGYVLDVRKDNNVVTGWFRWSALEVSELEWADDRYIFGTYSGQVNTERVGTTVAVYADRSAAISAYYVTNWISFGAIDNVKKLGKISLIFDASSASNSITLDIRYNWIQDFIDTKALTFVSSNTWGTVNWGSFTWGQGSEAAPKNISIPVRKVRSIGFKVSNTMINENIALQGIEVPFDVIRNRGNY